MTETLSPIALDAIALDPIALDQCPLGRPAHIAAIDWSQLTEDQARRLREMGFDEGVIVELLHKGPWGGDPLACMVGRMTVAIRRELASAIKVIPLAEGVAA